MTKPTLFLRIAAGLTFIQAVLHTIGGVFGKTEPGPATVAVQAMKANQFLLMSRMRSFWDFYPNLGSESRYSLRLRQFSFGNWHHWQRRMRGG